MVLKALASTVVVASVCTPVKDGSSQGVNVTVMRCKRCAPSSQKEGQWACLCQSPAHGWLGKDCSRGWTGWTGSYLFTLSEWLGLEMSASSLNDGTEWAGWRWGKGGGGE